ncbi:MAG: ABC transporter permease [Beijerinckiaceae bacterium]
MNAALIFRLALRDMRSGWRGFGISILCVALAVMTITGIGSLASSLVGGIAREGRTILGGDATFSVVQREATATEKAAIAAQGTVATITTMRAMVRVPSGETALVELKAVDDLYPTVGSFAASDARDIQTLLKDNGRHSAVVDPLLLARLNLKIGDEVALGNAQLKIAATIVTEPDKVGTNVGFGPKLITSHKALQDSGLLQPGSLVRWTYRLVLPGRVSDAALEQTIAAVKAAAPEAAWDIRARTNAAPQLARNIERFTQFLAIVALVTLVIGGVGVANAVRAFVERKQATIATLKAVGATGRAAFFICLIQVMAWSLVGIVLGLAAGATIPYVVATLGKNVLPVPIDPSLRAGDLLLGTAYGLTMALAFAIWPLGRAHDVPVSALFRDRIADRSSWPRTSYIVAGLLAFAALIGLIIGFAWDRRSAIMTAAAVAATFLLLRLLASLVMSIARRVPRPKNTALRLAVANIARPGSLTPAFVLSLGLGIALLVAIMQIDSNLRRELARGIPEKAPSFFFMDIPNGDAARFDASIAAFNPDAKLDRVPMMRGRLTRIAGQPAESVKPPGEIAWVLEGDRGITYAAAAPEGSVISQGEWWKPDHTGSNLVSFEEKIADGLGLTVGDTISVNVLGRTMTATIANLRRVEWRSFGINFVMVFSPNTFAGAPHTHLATVGFATPQSVEQESALIRQLASSFPSVTSVRVRDALATIESVLRQLSAAIRGASALTLIGSLLVLAGAFAAGHRSRLYDAVVLKTLGATRATLIRAYVTEYGLIGLAVGVFGGIAGMGSAYFVLTRVMQLRYEVQPFSAILAALLAIVLAISLGLLGTWKILAEKPARLLREL